MATWDALAAGELTAAAHSELMALGMAADAQGASDAQQALNRRLVAHIATLYDIIDDLQVARHICPVRHLILPGSCWE